MQVVMDGSAAHAAILAVFLGIFITGFFIHHVWLKSNYMATASIWRPEAEMDFLWLVGGQFVIAAAFTMIWLRIAIGGAAMICAVVCFFVGLLCAGNLLIVYAVQPIEHHVIMKWIIAGIVQGMVFGIIAFSACKPSKPLS